MKELISKLNAVLEDRRATGALLLLLGVLYTGAYLMHPLFPRSEVGENAGWWSWADQHRYLKEAEVLARFDLNPENYQYPPGYSFLGAIFWRLMPRHPFFVPDLLLVLATAWAWWSLASRLLSRLEAFVVAILFLAMHTTLLKTTMVVPWNTIATGCALLTGIWIVIAKTGAGAVWQLATLAACAYLVRPIDAAAFAPMIIFAVWRLPERRQRFFAVGVGFVILITAFLLLAGINRAVFGSWRSPYEENSLRWIGFFSYPISCKAFWIFVDGRPFFGEAKPALLFRYPWLFLALPGAIFWIKKEGAAAVAALGAIALNWMLYLNYNDFLPSDLYRFSLIHYLAWGFLPLFLISGAACARGWRCRWTRVGFGVAGLLFIFCCGITLVERPAQPSPPTEIPAQRPLLARFAGAPPAAMSQVLLDGQPMHEYLDYLTPFASPELCLLLGTPARGTRLALASGQLPELAEYIWAWRPDSARLTALFY